MTIDRHQAKIAYGDFDTLSQGYAGAQAVVTLPEDFEIENAALIDPQRAAGMFELLANITDRVRVGVATAEGEDGEPAELLVAQVAAFERLGGLTAPIKPDIKEEDADD